MMVNKISLEQFLSEKYPSESRSEVREVKIRPRSFDEAIEPKGFLDLRDFTNLEYLLLESVPEIKGWNLTDNTKLQKVTFSNSSFFCLGFHGQLFCWFSWWSIQAYRSRNVYSYTYFS